MTDYEKAIVEAVSHIPIEAKAAADRFLWMAHAVERIVVSELGLGTTIQDGRDGVAEWIENSRRSKERIEILEQTLALLKHGDCWCEMAIGNPMVRSHSPGCRMATSILQEDKK